MFLNKGRKLHTTHSWDFMLLEKNDRVKPSSLWEKARFGEDTIIANLDTGIHFFFFSLFLQFLFFSSRPTVIVDPNLNI